MKKYFYFLFLLCCGELTQSQTTDSSKFKFKSLYNYALQEDVKSIFEILDTLPDSRLSETDLASKEKYYSRFNKGNESYDYNTDEHMIRDVIDIYRVYWTSILLKQRSIELTDTMLTIKLSDYLIKNYPAQNNWKEREVVSEPFKYFSMLLSNKGYFNNVDGKTGNLYDIYIWKRQDTVNYNVQLPDAEINVPILFMKDIVTMGWEEYATLGVAYPGGWPRDGALFCVERAYDTTKENFYVSYLVHESQHFSDINKYEEIPSWQMEYRAKLAELNKANETIYQILKWFTIDSKNDSILIHPYAEYCVIRDLSAKIFNEEFVTDAEKWKTEDIANINNTSGELLQQNSSALVLKK